MDWTAAGLIGQRPILMTGNTVSGTESERGWQLLAEFAVISLSGSERPVAGRVEAILRDLALPPGQVERIGETVTQAVARANSSALAARRFSQVRIRIRPSAACEEGDGWGFFLVEKKAPDPRLITHETVHVIELFLYQVCPP
jgi:hypothetical protein